MEKWRIHRLKINGFKVFKEFEDCYSSNLVIYDGPNGFGKTSLFDAKQILFCKELPRVAARVKALSGRGTGNLKFSKSLYQHNGFEGDVSIVAEFKKGNDSLFVMRLAKSKDLKKSSNKPNSFQEFKLYELASFDRIANPKLIQDEVTFWSQNFGEKFLNNFPVLNYLQQDSKSIVIPDKTCNEQARATQIEHLINLDDLKKRIDNVSELKSESKKQFGAATNAKIDQEKELNELKEAITLEDFDGIIYQRLTTSKVIPQWDMEQPFFERSTKNVDELLEQVNLLKRIIIGKKEIAKRIRNKQKIDFTNRDEFGLAVRIFHQKEKLQNLSEQKKRLSELEKLTTTLNLETSKLTPNHGSSLFSYLDDDGENSLKELLKIKNKLLLEQGDFSSKQSDVIEVRDKLMSLNSKDEYNCPLCGFDYKERVILIAAVGAKTKKLRQQLDEIGVKITQCYQSISQLLSPLKVKYSLEFEKLKSEYARDLHDELLTHEHQFERISSIGKRLISLGVELPKTYFIANSIEDREQVSFVKDAVFKSLELEDEIITDQDMNFFKSNFSEVKALDNINEEMISSKQRYIQQQYNISMNSSILAKSKTLELVTNREKYLKILHNNFEKIETELKRAQTEYTNQTIGQMESLFHIYSGRLLQNYQSGLGVFINRADSKRKSAVMNFTTVRDSLHDATLSMSSGQISALSLSLFLALNKKYAKTAFVFIDDPTQCMDEINIASLSDLLRVEFRDRQVIISTHEQDVSDYLCYRYGKAGLTKKQINLLDKST